MSGMKKIVGMRFPKFSDLEKCPFCEGNTFYVRQHAEGTVIFRFRPDGSEIDNEDMYDMITVTEGINVYCDDCQNFLGNRRTDKLSSGALKALVKKEGGEQNGE